MSKNPKWIQFSEDEAWGEVIGYSEQDQFLDSLYAPTLPAQSLELMPDHDAPLSMMWITEHLADLVAEEQLRVIGPHRLTLQAHAGKLMAVAQLDAARCSATGDLRDQLTRQHREAKSELDDFERGVKFQSALQHYLEAAGPAFDRIAAATPRNPAAVLLQQQAAARHEGLKALYGIDKAPAPHVQDRPVQHGRDAGGQKRQTQAARIEQWLRECEQRAQDRGITFNRSRMPGTKIEFLMLLHALDAAMRSIKSAESMENHLPRLSPRCSWPLDASAQPSAIPLFSRLFPEARIKTPRVVSEQRRSA